MLQIISGKFFKSNLLHEFSGHAIFYSNLCIKNPINTIVGLIERDSDNNDYQFEKVKFVYMNKIEKLSISPSAGEVVCIGDEEIIESFRCISILGLNSYFSKDKFQLEKICKENRRLNIYHLEYRKNLTEENEKDFSNLVQKIIYLSRSDFEVINRCIKEYTFALEICDSNISSAYSKFVFCLETLVQKFSEDSILWEDYDPAIKDKLDEIFLKIPDYSNKIKDVLLSKKENKLTQKFIKFISSNISEDFFLSEAPQIISSLAYTELKSVLKNLYNARSKFVHLLDPINEHIRVNIFEGDVMHIENQAYLTLNGIIRLTRHVILQVIEKRPTIETENFNYRANLPGLLNFQIAPEYWISNPDYINKENIKKWFTGFLVCVENTIFERKLLPDVRPVLDKIECILLQSKPELRKIMLSAYGIFTIIINKDIVENKRLNFFNNHSNILNECSIEAMLIVLLNNNIPSSWTPNHCSEVMEKYLKDMSKPSAFVIPRLFQISIMILIANLYLKNKNEKEFCRRILEARLEASGRKNLQDHLLEASRNNVNVNVWLIFKECYPHN